MNIFVVLALYILVLSCALTEVVFKKKLSSKAFFLVLACLTIISTLKTSETSWDTNNYIIFFLGNAPTLNSYSISYFYGYEPFFVIINAFAKSLGHAPIYLFMLQSLISIGIYGFVIKKISPYPFFSLFIYTTTFFFLTEIIIIRFGIAVSFGFLMIYFMSQQKYIHSILILILATLTHVSATVLLLPFLLNFLSINKDKLKIMLLILGVAMIFSFFATPILVFIADNTSGFLHTMLQRAIDRYLSSESSAGLKRIIIYIPIFLVAISYFQRGQVRHPEFKQVFIYFYSALFFMIIFSGIANSFARTNLIFLSSNILMGPMLINTIKENYKPLVILYYLLICCYIFARHLFFNSGGTVNLHF